MPYQPPSDAACAWVARQYSDHTKVESTERLLGGLTSAMDLIVLRAADGATSRVVLRRWLGERRHVGDHVRAETAALRLVGGHGLGAPELIAVDATGDQAGVPSVLMTEVPGRVELAPANADSWISSLAEVQARIHQLPDQLDGPRTGWFDPQADFDWIVDEGLRRDAIEAASGPMAEQRAFVHGDYQHFNVLWNGDRISGVVDWTMAGTGPRGIDVGHCMLNLAVLFSAQVADHYLDCYQRAAAVSVDPRALLRAMLVWSPEWMDFIPIQVAGRTGVDLAGMAGRVAGAVSRTLARL